MRAKGKNMLANHLVQFGVRFDSLFFEQLFFQDIYNALYINQLIRIECTFPIAAVSTVLDKKCHSNGYFKLHRLIYFIRAVLHGHSDCCRKSQLGVAKSCIVHATTGILFGNENCFCLRKNEIISTCGFRFH